MSALDEEDTSSTDSDERAISNSAGEAQQAALPSTSSAYYAGLPALGLQATPHSAPDHHLGPPASSYFPAALQSFADDPYYASLLYGAHTTAPGGSEQDRKALPSEESEDEPVYVNAKQYHCIMRRRQQRARAEAQNKLVKTRKPFLHQSRHTHATKRVRGPGGRFLSKAERSNEATAYPETADSQPDRQEDNAVGSVNSASQVHVAQQVPV